jgi:two-component system nitrogen regulation response regulator GlnG
MTDKVKVWIVDDDEAIRFVLDRALSRAGYSVELFGSVDAVLTALASSAPQVIVTDIHLPDADGLVVLEKLREQGRDIPVIAITGYSDLDQAVTSFKQGVFDYIPKPFDLDQVLLIVSRAAAGSTPAEAPVTKTPRSQLIGDSPAMQEVFRTIGRLSCSGISVLITGETGTGKDLVARALHRHSPRSGGPFVAINTAAIPAELLESELFGHERGAFTGAHTRRAGRFEEAGGRDLLKADVRIIAATHQDLQKKIHEGGFREDLYHRLNVINIALPALRDRVDDIPILASHFLRQAASELRLEEKHLRPETLEVMKTFNWPGNVRQLQNLCQHMCVMAPGERIFPEDLTIEPESRRPGSRSGNWPDKLRQWARTALIDGRPGLMAEVRDQLEEVMLDCALEHTNGKRVEAARVLGVGRNTLTRKLKEREAVAGNN